MKTFYATLALAGLAALVGCSSDEAAGGLKLSMLQVADQTLHRGETNKVALTVARSNFDAAIEVEFRNLPDGVEVVENGPIPAGDNVRSYTLVASDDADLVEDHRAEVVVKGPRSLETKQAFDITVKE